MVTDLAPSGADVGLLAPAHARVVESLADRAADYEAGPTAWHRVGSPIVLDEQRLLDQAGRIRRLCALVDRLPDLAFGGDVSRYRRFLRLPPELAGLITDGGLGARFFARPDCVLSGGTLRVVELNVGTGTVNIAAAAASEVYFETGTPYPDVRGQLAGTWRLRELSPVAALAAALRTLADGDRVGLWHHDGSPAARRRVADVSTVLSAYGVDVVPVHTADVASFSGALYGYFSVLHLVGPDGAALQATVRDALERRCGPTLLRPGDLPRNLKANLALLYRLAVSGRLPDDDADIVLTHVPETVWLPDADPATIAHLRRHRDDWLVKPSASFKAQGVHIGRQCTGREWDDVIDSGRPAVAQRFVPSDPLPVLVASDRDLATVTSGRLVLMLHLIAGELGGVSARFAPDRDVLGLIDFDAVFPALCVAARKEGR